MTARTAWAALFVVVLTLLTAVGADAQAPAATPSATPTPRPQAVTPRPPASAPRPGALPRGVPTRMGQELVAAADVVAVVKVVSIQAAGQGAVVVRGIVLEALVSRGRERVPGDELVLVTYPGHVVEGLRELQFLEEMPGSDRLGLLYRSPEGDTGYAPKLDAARRTIALAAVEDGEERARATVDWLLGALAAEPGEHGEWWARYALDELAWMADTHPAVYRPGDGVRVARAGARWLREGPASELAGDVERVSQAVRGAARSLYEGAEKATSPP